MCGQTAFSTFQNCMTEIHWQLYIAFLAPLTPELYDEVGSGGVLVCISRWSCTVNFSKSKWSHFSDLSRESSLCTVTLSDILQKHWDLWDTHLVFDTRRNSGSHKEMWNSASYFSATALRIQCSNCALGHHVKMQQLKLRVKNYLPNSDLKGGLGWVIFNNYKWLNEDSIYVETKALKILQ